MVDDDERLPDLLAPIACRLANEGIPIRAIARGLAQSAELVRGTLAQGKLQGVIFDVPADDWPPTARKSDHLPCAGGRTEADLHIAARKLFKLTNLEGAFLMQLLKRDHADKECLHGVIETQRTSRLSGRPDTTECTDPKMVDVMICKLRKRLRDYDKNIQINTVWGSGYYIDPDVRKIVIDLLLGPGNGKTERATAAAKAALAGTAASCDASPQ